MTKKVRLDHLVLKAGLASSLEQARVYVIAGDILINNQVCYRADALVDEQAELRKKDKSKFVSRGGDKLAPVVDHFNVKVEDQVVLDVGSSTGGFTDLLLQRGAIKVYAVDVGHNQLSYKLRADKRVVVMEGVNVRDLLKDQFSEPLTLALVDVSFIGLAKIVSVISKLLSPKAYFLGLVKPQFELARELVEPGGVVSSLALQQQAVEQVKDALIACGFNVLGVQAAGLKGYKKGNQEYFIYAQLG